MSLTADTMMKLLLRRTLVLKNSYELNKVPNVQVSDTTTDAIKTKD